MGQAGGGERVGTGVGKSGNSCALVLHNSPQIQKMPAVQFMTTFKNITNLIMFHSVLWGAVLGQAGGRKGVEHMLEKVWGKKEDDDVRSCRATTQKLGTLSLSTS